MGRSRSFRPPHADSRVARVMARATATRVRIRRVRAPLAGGDQPRMLALSTSALGEESRDERAHDGPHVLPIGSRRRGRSARELAYVVAFDRNAQRHDAMCVVDVNPDSALTVMSLAGPTCRAWATSCTTSAGTPAAVR